MEQHIMTKTVTTEHKLPYLLYFPKDGTERRDGKYPLILFLHGMGERGNHLEDLYNSALPKMLNEGMDLPFIVAMPQCPGDSYWTEETKSLKFLIDELILTNVVDESRIYITGLSMGGYGTYEMLIRYPHVFAAGIPICGGIGSVFSKINTLRLRDKPLWIFHGEQDPVVSVKESRDIITVLNLIHSKNLKYTIYPDLNHDSWTRTYENSKIYRFLLSNEINK